MTSESTPRATRVPVPAVEPLIGDEPYDYADSFETTMPASDTRSAEEFARHLLGDAPLALRLSVGLVHKFVLRLQLGPLSSPQHLFGWRIVTSEPDVIQLEARSSVLGRGVIIARRPEPTRAVFTTYLFFARPKLARGVWAFVGPVHRRVAAYLLEHAATTARDTRKVAVLSA